MQERTVCSPPALSQARCTKTLPTGSLHRGRGPRAPGGRPGAYQGFPRPPDPVEEWRTSTPTSLVRHRERPPLPVGALPEPLSPMVTAVEEFTQTDPALDATRCIPRTDPQR